MTDAQMDRCRKRLERFLVDLLEPVGRSERRHWGSVYVRGLLLDGERKSVEPMARRLPDGNEQAMQQFVGQSPWEWHPVWQRLARRMVRELEPDAVWVIDDTGFPKQGGHSVGVERQYSGTLGKTANCQVAVSLHEVCTEGAAVLSWRLYLPESWANDPPRRAEAGIPEEVRFRKKWELALEMIDQARGWELTDRILVADAGYGDVTAFREELEKRKLRYAVGVQSHTGVWVEPPRPRKLKPKQIGRPPSALHYGKQRPVSVKETAQQVQGWKKFAGGKAARVGWSLASGPAACRLLMDFMRAVSQGKRSGCSWNGRQRPWSQPSTSSVICPPTTVFAGWFKWPSRAGKSSKIISNSRRNSGWITMRVAVGADGITT